MTEHSFIAVVLNPADMPGHSNPSIDRFADLLNDQLTEAYPSAAVSVDVLPGVPSDIAVSPESIAAEVAALRDALYREGAWVVDQ